MTRDPSAPRDKPADIPQTPPVARPEAPEGPDVTGKPESAPGHYGPGYGDTTRHLGEDPPRRDQGGPQGPGEGSSDSGNEGTRSGSGPQRA